jgi:hypothetical protein
MAFSRRIFLSFIGLLPFSLIRIGQASEAPPTAAAAADEIVVVKGWVLRRSDIAELKRIAER